MNLKKISVLSLAFFLTNNFINAATNDSVSVLAQVQGTDPLNVMLSPLTPSGISFSEGGSQTVKPTSLSKISIILNNVSQDVDLQSVIALASRIVDNSTAQKRNLSLEVFNSIRDDLGSLRSILAHNIDFNIETIRPIVESILKNCSTAYHADVNKMFGKLGLEDDQITDLKAIIINAAQQLQEDNPRSLKEVVTCLCTSVFLPIAAQLLKK